MCLHKTWLSAGLLLPLALAVINCDMAKAYAPTYVCQTDNKQIELEGFLSDVIKQFENKLGITVMYDSKLLAGIKSAARVTENKQDLVNELQRYNLRLDKVKDNSYVVVPVPKTKGPTEKKDASRLLGDTIGSKQINASQQVSGPVKGKVTDNKGEPLVGVTILEKGTSKGTITDFDGNFTFSPSVPDAILVFSYVGYLPQEVSVSGQFEFGIVLLENIKLTSEVVVVGYGSQNKRDLTGAVSSVSMKEVGSQPVPDIGQAVQGRVAGIQTIASGAPGSNVTFRIRGTGTINSADPLIVIDGIPTDLPLNAINPDDVASFDILKDASASAIYGSRGANGVVLITTRKGKAGESKISFSSFAGVQQATSLPQMLNASQFAQLNNEMLTNNNQSVNPAYSDPAQLGTGTNWMNELFRPANIQSYALSVAGGTEKTNYYVSGSYLKQDGIVIGTSYERYVAQINASSAANKWLKIGNSLTLNHDEKPSGNYYVRNAMAANPAQPVYNPDGSYSGPGGLPQFYGEVRNPLATANLGKNNTSGYNMLGSLYAEIKLYKGLKFTTTGGMQANFFNSRSWAPAYNYVVNRDTTSFLFEQYNKAITYTWDNFLSYDTTFGDHHFVALAGTDAQENAANYISGNKNTFGSDLTQQLIAGSTKVNTSGNGSEWALFSIVGRINYTFRDKYLVTATLRRDGSSRFGENNRYHNFPSVSAAWRIIDEPFMKRFSALNEMKLRVGYGETGNQNIGNYGYTSNLTPVQYNFNGTVVPAQMLVNANNSNRKWETVKQSNLGIDFGVLQNRITLSIDAYLKYTTGMLVPINFPILTGYSGSPVGNAGNVTNKGVEVSLVSRNLTGVFTWTTNGNISFNKNEITALSDNTSLFSGDIGLNGNIGINAVGHPINSFYGFETQGIFQTRYDVLAHATQISGNDPYNRTSAGDIRFKDLNNDGVINDQDRTYIGNPNPLFTYGLNNTFSWKGFDLAVFLQGSYGNDIFNANNVFQQSMAIAQNQSIYTLGRWQGPGTSNTMPRAVYNDPNQNARVSNRFVEDGSYMRIKTITMGYTFHKDLTDRLKISSLRLYATCQNLITFTRYTGFDPEVGANGIDFSTYPITQTMSAGLNFSF